MILDRPKVLFIGGYGRSGSTLLDRILGEVEGLLSTGELRHIWDRGLLNAQLCGCGVAVPQCTFWRSILAQGSLDLTEDDIKLFSRLKNHLNNPIRLPSLLVQASLERPSSQVRDYAFILRRLFGGIAATTGAMIIDSSKHPSYGLILTLVPDIELHVVHMVRDPRAVAFSWRRHKLRPEITSERTYIPTRSLPRSALAWNLSNLVCEFLTRRASSYTLIRYEDLIAEPMETLKEILRSVKQHPRDLPFIQKDTVNLKPQHTISGNPMRFEHGQVALKPDLEWQSRMPSQQRLVVAALTWPLMLRYGYLG